MDEIFPGVILWLMLVFVAIVGGLVSFRSSIDPHARPLARTKWIWLGMLLIAAGVMAAFFGFGWAWMASMEGASEVPGALMFFSGLGGTFIGIGVLAGRAIRSVKAERDRPEAAAGHRRPTRTLTVVALVCLVASQTYLVLYLMGYLEGGAGAFAAGFISLGTASWILGFLALRAAGRPRASIAFLVAAPLPVLAVDAVTFTFSVFPGVYVVLVAAVVVVTRLAWSLAFSDVRERIAGEGRGRDAADLGFWIGPTVPGRR